MKQPAIFELVRNGKIGAEAFFILLRLATEFSGPDGCRESRQTLAHWTGKADQRAADKPLKELRDNGLITWEYVPPGRAIHVTEVGHSLIEWPGGDSND